MTWVTLCLELIPCCSPPPSFSSSHINLIIVSWTCHTLGFRVLFICLDFPSLFTVKAISSLTWGIHSKATFQQRLIPCATISRITTYISLLSFLFFNIYDCNILYNVHSYLYLQSIYLDISSFKRRNVWLLSLSINISATL